MTNDHPSPPSVPSPQEFDPYLAPAAAIAEHAPAPTPGRFYVVSSAKFWCLYLGTFSLYGIYWVYRQWAEFKRATKGDEWPVMRAIFAVFFMHSLTAEIDQVLRRAHNDRAWHPKLLATVAVLAMLAGRVIDRLPETEDFGFADGLALVLIPVVGACMWRIQLAANDACADPAGASNARFTAANLVWLVLGGMVWLLLAMGVAAVAMGL